MLAIARSHDSTGVHDGTTVQHGRAGQSVPAAVIVLVPARIGMLAPAGCSASTRDGPVRGRRLNDYLG